MPLQLYPLGKRPQYPLVGDNNRGFCFPFSALEKYFFISDIFPIGYGDRSASPERDKLQYDNLKSENN
jgi:hypothetical protein